MKTKQHPTQHTIYPTIGDAMERVRNLNYVYSTSIIKLAITRTLDPVDGWIIDINGKPDSEDGYYYWTK